MPKETARQFAGPEHHSMPMSTRPEGLTCGYLAVFVEPGPVLVQRAHACRSTALSARREAGKRTESYAQSTRLERTDATILRL